jgi:GDP-L-fucose synthase
LINIGPGEERTIRELALLIKEVTGFEGEMVFDSGKPGRYPAQAHERFQAA